MYNYQVNDEETTNQVILTVSLKSKNRPNFLRLIQSKLLSFLNISFWLAKVLLIYLLTKVEQFAFLNYDCNISQNVLNNVLRFTNTNVWKAIATQLRLY